jgi:SAM-dependent methyltransferase
LSCEHLGVQNDRVKPNLCATLYDVEDTHWWFAGRRTIIFDQIRRLLDRAISRPRILDLGCGTGRNLVEAKTIGEPVGVDLEARALQFCRRRGLSALVQAGAERLPFKDDAFDIVMALDLLEHLDDDRTGVREAHRILRLGGHFIVFAPAYRWLWGPQDDVSHHHRRYTARSLARVLESVGFRIARLTHANLFLLPAILVGRLFLRAVDARLETENRLHPPWSNGLLRNVFTLERHLLRVGNLPLGVSLLCVATKDRLEGSTLVTSQ